MGRALKVAEGLESSIARFLEKVTVQSFRKRKSDGRIIQVVTGETVDGNAMTIEKVIGVDVEFKPVAMSGENLNAVKI